MSRVIEKQQKKDGLGRRGNKGKMGNGHLSDQAYFGLHDLEK